MRVTMASFSLLLATRRSVVSAFSSHAATRVAARASTARHMSSGPMPYDDDKMPFYALGLNLAKQISSQSNFKALLEEDELDIMVKGLSDVIKGEEMVDTMEVLTKFGPELNNMLRERTEGIMGRVKKDGEDYLVNFLDCNDDAVKTDSGLVFCSMTEGTGEQPGPMSTVEVHYHGTLTDGTVFDSSVDRGQTISFPLNQVIPAWTEGLQLMKVGGKATLVCPPHIAYGENGAGDTIPPGATLKFEVELFKVS